MENPILVFVYTGTSIVFDLTAKALRHYIQHPSVGELEERHKMLIEALPYKIDFFSKDDFLIRFPETAKTDFPAVFIKHEHGLQRLMDAEEVKHISTLDELRQKLLAHLAQI
jgi:hypothetical protein